MKIENKQMHDSFLLAKLFRTINTVNGLTPNFEATKFISEFKRLDGKISMFSSCFIPPNKPAIFPIAMTFIEYVRGNPVSNLHMFSVAAKTSQAERVWAFLSVIDHLVAIGVLPEGSREEHINRLTFCGGHAERTACCERYADFCTRAAKDLPYDLSLEVLGQAA